MNIRDAFIYRVSREKIAAALIAALLTVTVCEDAAAQSRGQVLSTQITVTARVLARASLRLLSQPAQIVVTDADIEKGYLDVNAGSLIEIKNNNPTGIYMIFETSGLPFKEVLISGFGRQVSLGQNGGIIANQIIGTSIVSLTYRFIFDKQMHPGKYVWPLSISVNSVQ